MGRDLWFIGCWLLAVGYWLLVVLMVVWCGTMYDKETCAVRPLGCVSGKETTGTSCIDWYDRETPLVFVAYFIASKPSKQTCRHTDAQLARERDTTLRILYKRRPPCSFTYKLQVNTPSNKDSVVNNRTIINHSVLLHCCCALSHSINSFSPPRSGTVHIRPPRMGSSPLKRKRNKGRIRLAPSCDDDTTDDTLPRNPHDEHDKTSFKKISSRYKTFHQ